MKRYFTFFGSTYYPSAGMGDFVGDFETRDEAIKAAIDEKESDKENSWAFDWAIVYDSHERKNVWDEEEVKPKQESIIIKPLKPFVPKIIQKESWTLVDGEWVKGFEKT